MYVVVELRGGESPGVKSNQVDSGIIWRCDRENGGEGVVGSVGFKDDLCIWNPMGQYQSSGENFFECFKEFSAFRTEVANNSFSSHTPEQNHDIGVVKNESPIKISKSKKGLNVLDFVRFRPFLDGLDLVISH